MLSFQEIGAYPLKKRWRSVQADQSLMHTLKRKCVTSTVNLAELFDADATDFYDMRLACRMCPFSDYTLSSKYARE